MRITRPLAALATAAAFALAGCGGATATASRATAPAAPRSSPAASPSSDGAAFCARLKAAVDPLPVYLNAVIDRDNLISGISSASPGANERAAKAEVAAWIAVWCPKYAYLTKG